MVPGYQYVGRLVLQIIPDLVLVGYDDAQLTLIEPSPIAYSVFCFLFLCYKLV